MTTQKIENFDIPNPILPVDPPADCSLCHRLLVYRRENKQEHPNWFNGAVSSFGDPNARLLIVGLAPGLSGANRTARPFTGDFAGDLLYATLGEYGFSIGVYDRRADDNLALADCRITNAVRCVPPNNKPIGNEIKNCQQFLLGQLTQPPQPKIILALGRVAHDSLLSTFKLRRADHPFVHGAKHMLKNGSILYDSYHCSRYNTNTRRLTVSMFRSVFSNIRADLDDLKAS